MYERTLCELSVQGVVSAMIDPARVGPRSLAPSGTVTFAFTDIERSTQRWERDRAHMQEAVRRHDELMRDAIAAHAGHVFKTIGDAFCAAFSRPEDAVSAMLAAQRALAAEDFSAVDGVRVRMAVHTGTADERDGDYFGPTVNRVARLLAAGHGGQMLVSASAAELLHGLLSPASSLRDLGEHRLKDLARPEHVYQVTVPDLPADFPSLRSLGALANNLPLQLTSFVGRDREVAEITALLDAHRLVTLVGAGGIGKTRTSLQVAANLVDGSGDGVWFVELAPLTSGEYLPLTVAQTLRVTLPPDGDPVESLADGLKAKRVLLVFDNCEHLLEPAARVIAAILRVCPAVKVLASSRQGLGIAGEETYRLPSLGVPLEEDARRLTARDAAQCAAIALFVERARALDKRFALTDENAPTIAEICRRLDGIPLAIELAAARVKILSPRQLRERLDERFRVLTGGSRDVLPRQQTLRALIDWSHDLLDEREQLLFRRLGIFVNGFTLEGASAIGDGLDALDVLSSLVDKSLVLAEPARDALRYRLLESTRVYAREKLAGSEEQAEYEQRHLRYFVERFAAARDTCERTARNAELNEALADELEDVRAALDYALTRGNAVLGGELLASIGDRWRSLGLDNEGVVRSEAFLAALPNTASQLLARLWSVVAYLAGTSGHRARQVEAATQAVTYARACGGGPVLADALRRYANGLLAMRRFGDAEAALGEAEAIPNLSAAAVIGLLGVRAALSWLSGDLAAAARTFEHLGEKHRSLGNVVDDLINAVNLAEVEHARGHTERAIDILRATLPAFGKRTDRITGINALVNLAGYLAAVDDVAQCSAIAREAIRELAPREPASMYVAAALEHLALALAVGGDLARAAALAGYVDAPYRSSGFTREATETATHDRLVTLLRARLAPEDLARLLAEGAALTPEAAVALALREP